MTRTKALGLLYKQLKKDSTRSRMGLADYVLVFRKPGDNAEAVERLVAGPYLEFSGFAMAAMGFAGLDGRMGQPDQYTQRPHGERRC